LPESDSKIKFILNVSRSFWKMEEEHSDFCPKKYLRAIFVLTKKNYNTHDQMHQAENHGYDPLAEVMLQRNQIIASCWAKGGDNNAPRNV
jgi:hypothetical protein